LNNCEFIVLGAMKNIN